ncbi:hypothetical protein M758_UG192700 [Ceratodon purpureus]|nr:hypothetical protein M758_UG192700 [Ceratodon purpureus]
MKDSSTLKMKISKTEILSWVVETSSETKAIQEAAMTGEIATPSQRITAPCSWSKTGAIHAQESVAGRGLQPRRWYPGDSRPEVVQETLEGACSTTKAGNRISDL